MWLKHLLKGMKEEITKPVILYCDNTSAIKISKNLVMHAKTKHIATKYHCVRELVEDKQVKMEWNTFTQRNKLQISSPNHQLKMLMSILEVS